MIGQQGYWGKFPDVFDPSFTTTSAAAMAAKQCMKRRDPWCMGYFSITRCPGAMTSPWQLAALASPAGTTGQAGIRGGFRPNTARCEALNQAWGTAMPRGTRC